MKKNLDYYGLFKPKSNWHKFILTMKITAFLLFCSLVNIFAAPTYSQSTKISLDLKDATIEEVLNKIENISEFYFLFNQKLVDVTRKVNIEADKEPIVDILNDIFNDDIKFIVYDRQIILTPSDVTSLSEAMQQLKITGTVTDKDGSPLPGVNVVVTGTTQGAITDIAGKYSIEVPQGSKSLTFSFIGMVPQEVNIGTLTEINVTMDESAIGLDEVVVIGYGTQSKRIISSAISSVNGTSLENIPITTVGDALKGKIPGVSILTSSGQPGEEVNIRIRGGSSITSSNSALILVDGVERSLAGINSNDIATIDVLKDAAATSIYGSRASNGVILVTTKRGGKLQKPVITVESSIAIQDPILTYDYLNAEEYLTLLRPAVKSSPYATYNFSDNYAFGSGNKATSIYSTRYLNPGDEVPEGWKQMPDPLDPTKTLIFQDNSFKDRIYRRGFWQNHYIGISGGLENVSFNGSVGYTDDTGVAIGTGFERFTSRLNADISITERIKSSTTTDFSQSKPEEYVDQGNAISRGLSSPPTQKVFWDDGTPVPGFNSGSASPDFLVSTRSNDQKDQRYSIKQEIEIEVFRNLSAKVNGSYYVRTWQRDYFEKSNVFSTARQALSSFSQNNYTSFDSYLTYKNTINQLHSINAMIGFTFLNKKNKDVEAIAQGGPSDKIETLNAAPEKLEAYSYMTEESLIGQFARLTYDYNKKYLISFSIRRDGSSRFSEGNKWGIFPAGSLGWIVSEEEFMNGINNAINYLKIRTSIGQTGNNDIGLYTSQGVYDVGIKYNQNSGIRATEMPNYNLGWETTTQADFGMDIGILKNRLSISADWYNKKTDNLLFEKPLPNTSGFSNIQSNTGSVKFYGLDLEVVTKNIERNYFKWETSFILSFVKNKVLKLPENGLDKNRIGGILMSNGELFGGIAEGEPLYRMYGQKVAYIIETDEEAANANHDNSSLGYDYRDGTFESGRKVPGDYEWVDRDGDGIISGADQFVLGYSQPHTTGGMNNTLRYKGFTVDFAVDWALGHSLFDSHYLQSLVGSFKGNWVPVKDALNTWKEPGDASKTNLARFTILDNKLNNNFRYEGTSNTSAYNTSVGVFKADYLCIRNITLAYDLHHNITEKLLIKDAKVFLSMSNLHYFTKVPGSSPEKGGGDEISRDYSYPPSRKVALGIKVSF